MVEPGLAPVALPHSGVARERPLVGLADIGASRLDTRPPTRVGDAGGAASTPFACPFLGFSVRKSIYESRLSLNHQLRARSLDVHTRPM